MSKHQHNCIYTKPKVYFLSTQGTHYSKDHLIMVNVGKDKCGFLHFNTLTHGKLKKQHLAEFNKCTWP